MTPVPETKAIGGQWRIGPRKVLVTAFATAGFPYSTLDCILVTVAAFSEHKITDTSLLQEKQSGGDDLSPEVLGGTMDAASSFSSYQKLSYSQQICVMPALPSTLAS